MQAPSLQVQAPTLHPSLDWLEEHILPGCQALIKEALEGSDADLLHKLYNWSLSDKEERLNKKLFRAYEAQNRQSNARFSFTRKPKTSTAKTEHH